MKPISEQVYRLVALSDLHCGDPRFDAGLFRQAINEINELEPELVVIAGDLTVGGYRDEFAQAKEFIDTIDCRHKVIIAGNHDCRNVGYLHFEEVIGRRWSTHDLDFDVCCGKELQKTMRLVAADSNKPDLNDGEIGRGHYGWIKENFPRPDQFKLFVLHHHLVSVPGTGRERNIVWDAGDVLETLRDSGVDLILCGHKHVPHVWQLGDLLVVNSGTVSTHRTRGFTTPSYNMIDIRPERIEVSIITPGRPSFETESFLRPKAFPDLKRLLAETTTQVSGRPRLS
jgi:3',5'-cyclic-AMP phosphodiesterase